MIRGARGGMLALALGAVALAPSAGLRAEDPPAGARCLLESYLRYLLAGRTVEQGNALAANAAPPVRAEVGAALDDWSGRRQVRIRQDLEKRFGAEARGVFEKFVNDFSAAEGGSDAAFLDRLAGAVGWPSQGARTYRDLRIYGLETWLADDVASGADRLERIQSWLVARAKDPGLPSLAVWLNAPAMPLSLPPPPAKSAVRSLRDAEAAPDRSADVATAGDVENPLAVFSATRTDRRKKSVEEATAAMQQIAQEREAWEQENASKKMAAAQTEAEALKRHAEELVAVDKQALEQRQNSMDAKCKQLLGSTVSAAVGGFTGAVGSQAADAAVQAVFK